MEETKPLHGLMDEWLLFFLEFLRHPLQTGSIIPSSRFLERRIVEAADINRAKTIVELGPGTGGTTRAILHEMSADAKLLSIELNPHLFSLVNRIKDRRFIAHLGSARDLKDILAMYGLSAPETVISGIPFSTMSSLTGSEILEGIASVLAPNGRFVAYQVSRKILDLNSALSQFRKMQEQLVFLNIPPLRIFRWEKAERNFNL